VTATDGHGATPLHYAARSGLRAAAKVLLKHMCIIDAYDSRRRTPVFVAFENGNLDVAQLLLGFGAQVGLTDISQSNPLHIAAGKSDLQAVRILTAVTFQTGLYAAVDNESLTPLQRAAITGDMKTFQALLRLYMAHDHKADITGGGGLGNTMLHLAAMSGHEDLIALLLSRGA
ncbi:ankyrin, partial [Zopfia rhizophila CBS 207.26]